MSDYLRFNKKLLALASVLLATLISPVNGAEKVWVTDQMLANPPAEDWLMWRRTTDAWAHSPLEQINRDNVTDLNLAWSLAMQPGMQEATPLVHKGVMYLAHLGNVVQALDAENGDLIWEYRRKLDDYVMNDFIKATRHLAIYQDKIYLATLDAHIVALNAQTGAVVWDHEVADRSKGFRYTSGANVFKGKIVAGMSGCTTPAVGGCYITAHDPNTGKELWRVHTLAQPGDPNEATWAGLPLERRLGGSPWMSGSFDPETNLTFWGTGVPVPYGEDQRANKPMSALYTNSTLAIDIDTGEMKWHRQHLPRDTWDMDHVFERYIVDRGVKGQKQRTVVGVFSKLGIVWSLDAASGAYLWSRETIPQNIVKAIDPETGAVEIHESMITKIGEAKDVCPSNAGGKNYNAGTFHPTTNSIYIAQNQVCMNMTLKELDVDKLGAGSDLHGAAVTNTMHAAPGKENAIGRIDAISVDTGKTLWTYEQASPWTGALLSTAGGLVVGGDANRRFKALDAYTGDVLWTIPLGAPITGYPITYSVAGRQYIAIAVGGNTATDLSFRALMHNPPPPTGSNQLMVFALPPQPQTALAKTGTSQEMSVEGASSARSREKLTQRAVEKTRQHIQRIPIKD